MMIDEKPSYLGGDPVPSFDTRHNENYPPKMTDRIMPPTAQPDLVSVRPDLPRPVSDTAALPYPYRADLAPYTENYMLSTHPLSYGNLDTSSVDYRDGVSSGCAILAGAVAGYLAEPMIAKKGYPQGYGAILGALVGNAFHQAYPYVGVDNAKRNQAFVGAAIPAIPFAALLYTKKNMSDPIIKAVGGLALLGLFMENKGI